MTWLAGFVRQGYIIEITGYYEYFEGQIESAENTVLAIELSTGKLETNIDKVQEEIKGDFKCILECMPL